MIAPTPTVPTIVTVPVQSAWYSKINWTQAIGLAISGATALSGILPPQYGVPVALGVQAAQSVATWYFKTFATTTITPSSAVKV